VSKIDLDLDDANIKSIAQVICSRQILSKYEIKTIYDLSKKYFIHIHKVLNLFLPKFIFNALEKKAFEDMTKEDKKIEN
jgi:primosomal protein N'